MNEMTAGEAAEILEALPNNSDEYKQYAEVNPNYILISPYCMKAIKVAASELRRVESGELAEVKHGHWIRKYDDFSQNYNSDENWYFVCSECGGADRNRAKYCHCCSALMDGKDDSHE